MKHSGLGITSMILGIVGSLISCTAIGIFPCAVGVVMSIVSLCEKNKRKETAIVGLICSAVGCFVFLLLLLL